MTHTATDLRFRDLIDDFAPFDQVATGFMFTEGPIWHPLDKTLFFSDMPGDVRRRRTPDGRVEEVQRPSEKANGLTCDAALDLIVCAYAPSSVVCIHSSGAKETLASHFEGKELDAPNDVVVRSDGAIYFTDPTYKRLEYFEIPREPELGFQGVYRLAPNHKPGDEAELVSDRHMFSQPNGLTPGPCEKFICVNDTEQANIRFFAIADDGRLINGRVVASGIRESARAGQPDGMKADLEQNIYVTAPGGVWVYDFHGVKLGEIICPEQVVNLHWGGNGWDALFMWTAALVYQVRTKSRPHLEPLCWPIPV